MAFYNLFWFLNENPFRSDQSKRQISWKKFKFRRFRIRENMWWTRYRSNNCWTAMPDLSVKLDVILSLPLNGDSMERRSKMEASIRLRPMETLVLWLLRNSQPRMQVSTQSRKGLGKGREHPYITSAKELGGLVGWLKNGSFLLTFSTVFILT